MRVFAFFAVFFSLSIVQAYARDIFIHPDDEEYEDYQEISALMFNNFDEFTTCAIEPMKDIYVAVNQKRITKYLRREKIPSDEPVVWAWCEASTPHCFDDDGQRVCFEPRGWAYFQKIKYQSNNRIRAIWRFNYLGHKGTEDAEKIAASNLQYYFFEKSDGSWKIAEMFNQIIVDARPDEQKAVANALVDEGLD